MPLVFSAEEVLKTAEQIERNGVVFYNTASGLCKNPDGAKLLSTLAEWEITHTQIFHEMRRSLKDNEKAETVFDPNDEMALYLKSMANSVAFTAQNDPVKQLGPNPSYESILRMALEREKDTVIFYSNIKDMVPETLGTDKIEAIIKEELRHVAIIQRQLDQAME